MSEIVDQLDVPAPMAELMDALGHQFDEPHLLEIALTHRSFRNENKELTYDNERLEFLGDAVLGCVVSYMLFERFRDSPEGVLTRYKAVLVSEQGLAETANKLDLGRYLHLGRGEKLTGGRDKSSVLSNTMEAVLAAVFLDAGFDAAIALVRRLYDARIDEVGGVEKQVDFKTKLQELCQTEHHALPDYRIVNVEGPDHDRIYSATVSILGRVASTGTGRSKKEAEQAAAQIAYFEISNALKDLKEKGPHVA